MAMSFTRLSWWSWGGKEREPTISTAPKSAPDSSESQIGLRETDWARFPTAKGPKLGSSSSPPPRRVKKKWKSRAERRQFEREYDMVLVPSDGGSDTDDSDWSIGWMEPLASDLRSDDEKDGSFAVLVRCYGVGHSEQLAESPKISNILTTIDGCSYDGRKYMEEWLSFLQSN